jgi:hypothetical protein
MITTAPTAIIATKITTRKILAPPPPEGRFWFLVGEYLVEPAGDGFLLYEEVLPFVPDDLV